MMEIHESHKTDQTLANFSNFLSESQGQIQRNVSFFVFLFCYPPRALCFGIFHFLGE